MYNYTMKRVNITYDDIMEMIEEIQEEELMGIRPYNEARAAANAKYDAKTYKLIGVKLRLEDDADIIQSWEDAKQKGISSREWLRDLFEKAK